MGGRGARRTEGMNGDRETKSITIERDHIEDEKREERIKNTRPINSITITVSQ